MTGSYDVPRTGGLKVSAVYTVRSGTPFSLIDSSVDHDRNGLTTNEYLPAGPYTYTDGEKNYDLDYEGGRNGGRGPNFQRLDLRLGYRFRFAAGHTFDAFLDLFNATNEPNFNNPGNDKRITADYLADPVDSRRKPAADGAVEFPLRVLTSRAFDSDPPTTHGARPHGRASLYDRAAI